MREKLFKGKAEGTNEWVSGGYYHSTLRNGEESDNHYILPVVDFYDEDLRAVLIKPETLCEFTGFTDRNGIRIFEGDLMLNTYAGESVYVVLYCTHHGGYILKPVAQFVGRGLGTLYSTLVFPFANCDGCETHTFPHSDIGVSYDFSVIGNIYDNLELLERGITE